MSATCMLAASQSLTYRVEFNGAAAGGDYAPFWHVSARQGLGSVDTESGYMRVALAGENSIGKSKWTMNYGIDFVAAENHTSALFVQQAYVDFNWRMLSFSLGQKERWSILNNPRLSTGGLTESGNARPVPQIRVSIPRYHDFFGTGGWFTLRGCIAYGWFTDEDWQNDFAAEGTSHTVGVRYHYKNGYIKIGNADKFPLTFEAGLEMAAQFGGTLYNWLNTPGLNYHNPSRFQDYLKVFVPTSGDSNYNDFEQNNVAGNHLGSWNAALAWHGKDTDVRLYYEHVFDDHSQMFWEYGIWTEQLVGLELGFDNCRWIKSIVLEYFNLKNQSGPIYHDSTAEIPDQISSADNNYNNAWYGGWFNYGMIMGTPLVKSPVYNSNRMLESFNNRVEAFHIGFEGNPLSSLSYRLLLTKSNNWGSYRVPFTDIKENLSGLIELTYTPSWATGWEAAASFAFDNGELYGNNNGAMLSIRKNGLFKF